MDKSCIFSYDVVCWMLCCLEEKQNQTKSTTNNRIWSRKGLCCFLSPRALPSPRQSLVPSCSHPAMAKEKLKWLTWLGFLPAFLWQMTRYSSVWFLKSSHLFCVYGKAIAYYCINSTEKRIIEFFFCLFFLCYKTRPYSTVEGSSFCLTLLEDEDLIFDNHSFQRKIFL